MNTPSVRTLGLLVALSVAAGGCQKPAPAPAAPEASSEVPAAAPVAESTPEPAEASAEIPLAIPDTADGIWTAIDQHVAELKATVASGDLKEVHHHAFAIRDLVAALPSHSPSAGAEADAKRQGEVKFVATLAERLDAAGDAGDRAAAQAETDKLLGVLTGITRTK